MKHFALATAAVLISLAACTGAPPAETNETATQTTSSAPPVIPTPPAEPAPPVAAGGTRLAPVDEGPQNASFAAFRDELRAIVKRRDGAALLPLVAPDIRITFGPENGIDAFRKEWKPEDPRSPLWSQLDTLLSLGGAFQKIGDGPLRFVAPYTFAKWPESVDAFENLAAVCPDMKVYERPDASSRALARLAWHILPIGPDDPMRKGQRDAAWRQVVLPDGRNAWAEARCVRLGVDYRVGFEQKDGRWSMTYLIAGD